MRLGGPAMAWLAGPLSIDGQFSNCGDDLLGLVSLIATYQCFARNSWLDCAKKKRSAHPTNARPTVNAAGKASSVTDLKYFAKDIRIHLWSDGKPPET